MRAKFPNSAIGAEMALQEMARSHMALSTRFGALPGEWLVEVMWLPEERHATCVVYLPPHVLASGPFGADFETLD